MSLHECVHVAGVTTAGWIADHGANLRLGLGHERAVLEGVHQQLVGVRACWVLLQRGTVSSAQQLVDAIFRMYVLPTARSALQRQQHGQTLRKVMTAGNLLGTAATRLGGASASERSLARAG
jgi:hypothetical protein